MAKSRKKDKIKTRITLNDYIKANRCGNFDANKDIANLTKGSVYKSKKTYTRKNKHKKEMV